MEKPLINNTYQLEKFPGKGGWTYVLIPEVSQDKNAPFGWVKVKGTIDDFPLEHCRLMPMGNGKLFLPVKAEIRKKIGKNNGDRVQLLLYPNHDPLEIPEELLACLKEHPKAHNVFMDYSEGEQKAYMDWIYAAKKVDTKVDRIAQCIDRLERGLKFGNK